MDINDTMLLVGTCGMGKRLISIFECISTQYKERSYEMILIR